MVENYLELLKKKWEVHTVDFLYLDLRKNLVHSRQFNLSSR